MFTDLSPQAHGNTVLAFHPEVLRVSLFIFSQRKAWCKDSSIDMNKIACLKSELESMTGVNMVYSGQWTHTGQPQG